MMCVCVCVCVCVCSIASLGSCETACQPDQGASGHHAPTAAAALADFSKCPESRRTNLDLFAAVAKQSQTITAVADHSVSYVDIDILD